MAPLRIPWFGFALALFLLGIVPPARAGQPGLETQDLFDLHLFEPPPEPAVARRTERLAARVADVCWFTEVHDPVKEQACRDAKLRLRKSGRDASRSIVMRLNDERVDARLTLLDILQEVGDPRAVAKALLNAYRRVATREKLRPGGSWSCPGRIEVRLEQLTHANPARHVAVHWASRHGTPCIDLGENLDSTVAAWDEWLKKHHKESRDEWERASVVRGLAWIASDDPREVILGSRWLVSRAGLRLRGRGVFRQALRALERVKSHAEYADWVDTAIGYVEKDAKKLLRATPPKRR